eukprot:CAMPEP_0115626246 /NCGR_PEP_ID=MMETSP0272-20121206/28241_1 /TAXON_ID=71861 /ORGANISM="Scrippsiella trochoidea, Strain CCMP3099" /LENGTH=159 /DNA_ID=CAMNT_0003062587 /DNA_START=126 /DNA_END=606 /DNA_ORIENTATION=-
MERHADGNPLLRRSIVEVAAGNGGAPKAADAACGRVSSGNKSPLIESASKVNAFQVHVETLPSRKTQESLCSGELALGSSTASPQCQAPPSVVCHKLKLMSFLGGFMSLAVSCLGAEASDSTSTVLPAESIQQPSSDTAVTALRSMALSLACARSSSVS